jgi:hypothetical protein
LAAQAVRFPSDTPGSPHRGEDGRFPLTKDRTWLGPGRQRRDRRWLRATRTLASGLAGGTSPMNVTIRRPVGPATAAVLPHTSPYSRISGPRCPPLREEGPALTRRSFEEVVQQLADGDGLNAVVHHFGTVITGSTSVKCRIISKDADPDPMMTTLAGRWFRSPSRTTHRNRGARLQIGLKAIHRRDVDHPSTPAAEPRTRRRFYRVLDPAGRFGAQVGRVCSSGSTPCAVSSESTATTSSSVRCRTT